MMKRRNIKESYQWVPVPRSLVQMQEPLLKRDRGIFANYIRMCAKAAYKSAIMMDGKFRESVGPGEWFGGITGLRRATIGMGSDKKLSRVLSELVHHNYISLIIEERNQNLHSTIKYSVASQYVLFHDPNEKAIHFVKEATTGFFGIFRNAQAPLFNDPKYRFSRLDAWYDLYLHTVLNDYDTPQSFLVPVIQIDGMSILSYTFFAKRWRWSKTAVANFFQVYKDDFMVVKMAGNYGSMICNRNDHLLKEYGIDKRNLDIQKISYCVIKAVEAEKKNTGTVHLSYQDTTGRIRPFLAISRCIVRNAQYIFELLRTRAYVPQSRIQDAAMAERRGKPIYNNFFAGGVTWMSSQGYT